MTKKVRRFLSVTVIVVILENFSVTTILAGTFAYVPINVEVVHIDENSEMGSSTEMPAEEQEEAGKGPGYSSEKLVEEQEEASKDPGYSSEKSAEEQEEAGKGPGYSSEKLVEEQEEASKDPGYSSEKSAEEQEEASKGPGYSSEKLAEEQEDASKGAEISTERSIEEQEEVNKAPSVSTVIVVGQENIDEDIETATSSNATCIEEEELEVEGYYYLNEWLLAQIAECEAGGYGDINELLYICMVVVNRTKSNSRDFINVNTVEEVLTQKGQYPTTYRKIRNGVIPSLLSLEAAHRVLSGETIYYKDSN